MTIALALTALTVGSGAEALARTIHPQLTIKVKRKVGQDTIKGRVKGKDPACVRNRKVKLVASKPDRSKIKFGAVKANRKGKWKFTPERNKDSGGYSGEGTRYADPGDYRAKVRKTRTGGVTCGAGKSSRVWVG